LKYSNRITEMQESPIRKLVPYSLQAKKNGKTVYHLNIGQPDITTPKQMLDVFRNISLDVIAYGPSQGLESYREALPRYYASRGISVNPEDILITTSGSEALLFSLIAICDPGDEVIIPQPYYTNMNGFAKMANVTIVPIMTNIEDGFSLPAPHAFEELITERTKAIYICNPNNPTGAVYSQTQLSALADIVNKYDLYLVADEVYREFVYDGNKHVSILQFKYISQKAIVVDSISKRYSACGSRIGAFVSKNQELLNHVLKMAQARLCPPTLEQMSAEAALSIDDSYFTNVTHEYGKRRDIVYDSLQNIPGVLCRKPPGAFYIMAQLPVANAEDFAIYLLKDFSYNNKTVMLAPGEGFYHTEGAGRNEVRIAYVLNSESMTDAMDILRQGLEKYQLENKL